MTPHALLSHLADGRFHSGQDLAARFGVSRAAVWKQLKQLETLPGVVVHAVRGRGYKLAAPLELLDAEQLVSALGAQAGRLTGIDLLQSVDSTNAYLMAKPAPPLGQGQVCLTEHQTAGRGRRGRPWVSGYGRNLTLSLSWTFDLPMSRLAGLSLAVGVAVADALADQSVQDLALKWPNDLYLDGRKLAGFLVEASGEANGPTRVVIGIGLNVALPPDCADAIDQPWTDLRAQLGDCPPRNRLAAGILSGLLNALPQYAEHGLPPFLQRWQAYDLYRDQTVQVLLGEQAIQGRYVGLNEDGNLLLDTPDGRRSFAGGEVSLRPRDAI